MSQAEAIADLQHRLKSAEDAVRLWEMTMMKLVGEDGPASVAEAIEALRLQRDTAWRELAAIRKSINANPEESTFDEVVRVMCACINAGQDSMRERSVKACEAQADESGGQDWYVSGCIDSARAVGRLANELCVVVDRPEFPKSVLRPEGFDPLGKK